MYSYEIRKLTNDFYNVYNQNLFPELLNKSERSYDIILFELDLLKDCFVGIPFRTEMKHNNGYHFKFSKRSQHHASGLDFSKLVIIHKNNSNFIGDLSIIDSDEYIEFEKNEDKIHKNIEKYILDYTQHIKQEVLLHPKQFDRKYKYATLKYFHIELGLLQ